MRMRIGVAIALIFLLAAPGFAGKHPLHGKWTFHMFGDDLILSFHKDQIVLQHTHAGDDGREYGRWDQKARNLFTLRSKDGLLRIKFVFVDRDTLKGKVLKATNRKHVGTIISAPRIKPEKKDGE
jgi:hypothetical protein